MYIIFKVSKALPGHPIYPTESLRWMLRMRMFTRHSIASFLWVVMPVTHTPLKSWREGSVSLAVSHSHMNLFSSIFLDRLLPLLHAHVWRSFQANQEAANKLHNQSKRCSVSFHLSQMPKTLRFFFNKPNKYREGNFVFGWKSKTSR